MENRQAINTDLNSIEKTKLQSLILDKIWELEKINENTVAQVSKAQLFGSVNLINHLMNNIGENTKIINYWWEILKKLN